MNNYILITYLSGGFCMFISIVAVILLFNKSELYERYSGLIMGLAIMSFGILSIYSTLYGLELIKNIH